MKNKLVKQLVTRVLANHPEARNSDVELHICCLEEQGLALSYYQKSAIRRAFAFETIRRARQKIQEEGLYPASDNTRRGRKAKELKMRIEMKKKEYIPQYDEQGRVQGYLIK